MIVYASVTVVILAVSLVAGVYYFSSGANATSKDREILILRAQVLLENATILELKRTILQLNANLTALSQRLAALSLNQTINSLELTILTHQIAALQNETAQLSLELAVAEQVGNLSVSTLVANETVTVQPGATATATSQANGSNGTLVFYSPVGCPVSGHTIQATSAQYKLYILLDSAGASESSYFASVSGQPYTVYLQNVGTAPVQCTFSLLYVQH